MQKLSSIADLGDTGRVYLLHMEFGKDLLGGVNPHDTLDRDRVRDVGGLLRRVATRQALPGEHAFCSVRSDHQVGIQWGFSLPQSFEAIAALIDAAPATGDGWAARKVVVLDEKRRAALEAGANARDTRGPGRRARKRAEDLESMHNPRWVQW